MKKRLTLGWLAIGLGISAIAFSSPVTSLEELQTHTAITAPYFPLTSLLLPQASPIIKTPSKQKHMQYQSLGVFDDLTLAGCAVASLLFARKYHLRLLSEED